MDKLFTHEFTHFVHLTTKLGWYGKLTEFIGDGAAISNSLSPGWVVEGLTTTTETLFTDGGRGRSALFQGTIQSFAEGEGLWSLPSAGAHPVYAPPAGRIYLAGYHMIDYLNRTFGPTAAARMARYQGEHPVGEPERPSPMSRVNPRTSSMRHFWRISTDRLRGLRPWPCRQVFRKGG